MTVNICSHWICVLLVLFFYVFYYCLSLFLNRICKKKKKRPLLNLSILHYIYMDVNSRTNSSCNDSLECAYHRWIYERKSSLSILCLHPWSLLMHDFMELHKSWLKTGCSVRLISNIVSSCIVFYDLQTLSGWSNSRESDGNISILLLNFLLRLCN